jgi:hypothetical protein
LGISGGGFGLRVVRRACVNVSDELEWRKSITSYDGEDTMATAKQPTTPKPADELKASPAPKAKAKKAAPEAAAEPAAPPAKAATPKKAATPPAEAKPAAPAAPAPQEAAPASQPASRKAKPAPAEPTPAATLPDHAEIGRMIAEAAYYLAEKRNFEPGHEAEDWAQATAEVMARLGGGQ